MKKSKRFFVVLLCISLCVGVGCNAMSTPDANISGSSSAGTSSAAQDQGEYRFSLPLIKEPVTLTVAICANPSTSQFDASENLFTQWLEEQTNVKLKFEVFPVEQQIAAINTYLAAGQYADIMMFQSTGEFSSATMYSYAKNGSFLPLTQYIDKYGEGVKALFEKMPLLKSALVQEDGEIYTLPSLNEVQHQFCIDKAFVYRPFLDAVGIKELPTTREEFKDMLIAFRDNDPNGNGKADEIPSATYYTNDYVQQGAGMEAYLMDTFIVTSKSAEMRYSAIQNGKIAAGFMTSEWRDGLRWIKDLYDEKLIAPESFTQDSTQFTAMGENPEAPILGVGLCGQPMRFITVYGESGRWIEYECIPPLAGPSDKQETLYNPYFGYRTNGVVITSNCKNPELAFQLIDFIYREDTTMRKFYGVYDKQWTDKDLPADGIGINGQPAAWKQLAKVGTKTAYSWFNSGPLGLTMKMRTSELASEELPLESWLYNETQEKYIKYKQSDDTVMPILHYEVKEAEELLDLTSTINNYVSQMVVAFVTGKSDLDADWDNYCSTLESMGTAQCLEIMNKAYDNYLAQQ